MPVSKHRRKGKNRRATRPDPRPIFRHMGRKYRGAARIAVTVDELDQEHGDDNVAKVEAVFAAALGEDAADELYVDVLRGHTAEVHDLARRIATHYTLDLAGW